jgi:polyhydroxyalkanoate synthase subunit PhaC
MHNELFELIQYRPTTADVYETPLLIVPPTINKFYIIDLAPGRSLVEYLVGQGHQVFVVSWRNPDREHAYFDFDATRNRGWRPARRSPRSRDRTLSM